MAPRIGFFGTGVMGTPMVRSLMRHGFPVAVWNRTAAKYAELVNEGATAPGSPRAVAAASDVLISMLIEPSHLDAILHGDDGIVAGLIPGSIFIDMGTGPPRNAQRLERLFAQHGVAALDAPVRGGLRAAVDGALVVMVGGDAAAQERVRPVLEAIGKTVISAGPSGSGQIAKLCHQIVAAVTVEALAEALALAKSFGAEQTGVRDVLLQGIAASPILKADADRMIERNWEPGRPLWLYLKDGTNVEDTLSGTGLELPLAQTTFARIAALARDGRGELDESALYTLLEPELSSS